MELSNKQVADILREAATALTIKKGNLFQIRAYESAADAIEHATASIYDLWKEDRLGEIPGIGEHIQDYVDELFRRGKVAHFARVKKGIPAVVFSLIDIPGVGPKTAMNLAKLGVENIPDLEKKIKSGKLIAQGFSPKIAEKIARGITELGAIKSGRLLLPSGMSLADKVLSYVCQSKDVSRADPLGSLRRRVATIGDLDFAIATQNPESVIEWIKNMPGIVEVVNAGEDKITLVLQMGVHVDFLLGKPESYGALLQHFTGSKMHNIELRTLAESKGYSLSEYGVKQIKSGKITPIKKEEELYSMLGMQTPSPEIREGTGEIAVALAHQLPRLVQSEAIRGDLHLHSNFPMSPSHGPGANSLQEVVEKAIQLGYEYVGISDHSPAITTNSNVKVIGLIRERTKAIEELKYSKKKIKILNGLEVDILPNGTLSVPSEALATLDYVIAGIHSVHNMPKEEMTARILTALSNPYVGILSHPTGRILNERLAYDADWDKIFSFCAKHNKALEINASANRLDLRDDLVRAGLQYGVKFIIDTDAHEVSQMNNMMFGIFVARRGWATSKDIINTWKYDRLCDFIHKTH